MARLGPFDAAPRLALAVSGGADSLALALLANGWARRQGGEAIGLIVDHGLRPEAAAEAAACAALLGRLGVRSRVLGLRGLGSGPGIPARARARRLALLEAAAAELGVTLLLLGHHAADQAETLLLRALDGSGEAGLAGMAARRESARVAVLRPFLGTPPGRLRATLAAAGLTWLTDPSNADPAFLRARLRRARDDAGGDGVATGALAEAAAAAGQRRARKERAWAGLLATRAALHPEGYARLAPGPIEPGALAALLRVLGGAEFAPSDRRVAALAACPAPTTLAGVRLLRAGPPRARLAARARAPRHGAGYRRDPRTPLGRPLPSRPFGTSAARSAARRARRRGGAARPLFPSAGRDPGDTARAPRRRRVGRGASYRLS